MHGMVFVYLVTKLIIYTPFFLFPTFFPYIMSWLHHAVHVHSLIISTLLHIIVAYARSVILGVVIILELSGCKALPIYMVGIRQAKHEL